MSDDSLSYDILVIGAGPSGLATAITIKQQHPDISVAILEKGAEIGAHILSGAVIETDGILKLAPNILSSINHTKVNQEKMLFLTSTSHYNLPIPSSINNKGNIIVSLGETCRYLGTIAEELGVEILTSIAADQVLYKDNQVVGVKTNAFGLNKKQEPMSNYQPPINIYAKQTVVAEGCRGSIANQIIDKFALRQSSQIPTYGLGIKELWEVPNNMAGLVIHTLGWPLSNQAYGGGFVYHSNNNQIAIGLITGLDYQNPYLDPFQEMQKLKTHPYIKDMLKGGSRINYGAKTISEGGFQSIPKLTFPGGLIVGDSAGFVNVPKIKGTNNAIQSGIIAGKNLASIIQNQAHNHYQQEIYKSYFVKQLKQVRNIRPAYKYGLVPGIIYSGIELFLLKGKSPWTLKHRHDRKTLLPASKFKRIHYAKPDEKLTFNKVNSLFLSGTMHRDDEPCHLKILNDKLPIEINKKVFDSPETRYCPANVYEIVYNNSKESIFQINAQNCLHCKACDIKDPKRNISWSVPEGGEGPNYMNM